MSTRDKDVCSSARPSPPTQGTGLPIEEAKEMDALLEQQALERIRQRGWSYAGMNKVKRKAK
jgi:hypothetical protein